jgi:hypothetical protein
MQRRLQSVLIGGSPRLCARHGRGAFPRRNGTSGRERTLDEMGYQCVGGRDVMNGVNKRKITG